LAFLYVKVWKSPDKVDGKLGYKKAVICHDDKNRRKYNKDFKQKAVELSHARGNANEIANLERELRDAKIVQAAGILI